MMKCVIIVLLAFAAVAAAQKTAIVIGAGFSGMGAATTLTEAGYLVQVLEGRDRLGGRSYQVPFAKTGLNVHVGANWIHGVTGNVMTDLAAAAGVNNTAYTNYDDDYDYDWDGKFLPGYDEVSFALYTDFIKAGKKASYKLNNDVPLQWAADYQYKKQSYSTYEQVEISFQIGDDIELDYAAPITNLSAWNYDVDSELKGDDVLMLDTDGGYKTVIDKLAANLTKPVILNCKVLHIEQTPAGATAFCEDGRSFTADHMVVTVPLGVLKKNVITFSPALTSTLTTSIDKLNMGLLDKIYVQFPDSEAWGGKFHDYFYYVANNTDPKGEHITWSENLNVNHYESNYNALCCFTTGDFAIAAEQMSDEEVEAKVTEVFRLMFPKLPAPTAVFATRWWNDPFAYGSYSSIPTGATAKDMNNFMTAQGVIHFAGEHTIHQHFATTNGAYSSGVSAANAIIQGLKGEHAAAFRLREHARATKAAGGVQRKTHPELWALPRWSTKTRKMNSHPAKFYGKRKAQKQARAAFHAAHERTPKRANQ